MNIMKKVIPLRPDAIEFCFVENKEQYDELCRLAISYGYRIDSEYTLTHSGKRMCTNYDLMAIYIKDHPQFILDTDINIDDSNEMMKLLDIYVEAGFKLNDLDRKKLLKLFIKIDENEWDKYLDANTIYELQKSLDLRANNDNIATTLNPKFFNEDHTFGKESKLGDL